MERAFPFSGPLTRNFRHMIPLSKRARRLMPKKALKKEVPVDDRIKYWNLVPGDRVRIKGENKDKIVTILSVDKFKNQLLLKGITRGGADKKDSPAFAARVHYSNVQLHIGKFEFPPKPGSDEPEIRDVFATRLSTSKPFYLREARHWVWHRFAAATSPALPTPEGAQPRKSRIRIKWPKVPTAPKPEASIYDTVAEDALKITWRPFELSQDPHLKLPDPETGLTLQDYYLESFRNPNKFPYDPSVPMEYYLSAELSNPHSRAKKQARWKERIEAREQLKVDTVKAELDNLDGRTRAEARREGLWKFEELAKEEDKARKHERWVQRGGEVSMARNKKRKEKKQARKQTRLREMILSDAKNQVLPESMRSKVNRYA
ncbi:hypothetical protein BOTBODRAFT_159628 [Botryobasidium botryosum FD-172 SS1]|uniref:KOW domain-containing protein n=1 Tax=Botryobasidium botryosum (strain FD-172 SS1) TaxID=930990 RepID=A0A067MHA0_BOTB1|nr:hypothetical protein BOTBODRAFT_159628 [Botryobasidium botryosum FD-172 SS1]